MAIFSCITASPAHRADIVKVAEHIAVILMTNLDTVRKENQVFEKKLEHEKRRSKRFVKKFPIKNENYVERNIA